ncbi:MAG TPA: tetratricopeptide repeat protein [Terracidiphilus sp.]|nr:tetratricopeptide repeat protein [Terracidiphilus sp.]
MKWIASAVLCCAAGFAFAQTQPSSGTQQQGQSAPANPGADKPKPTQEANPFPTDTDTVPVMPNANAPGSAAPAPDAVNYSNVPLPGELSDPVKSPDDGEPAAVDSAGGSSSSSGMDELLKAPPETAKELKKDKNSDQDNGMSHDSAKEDETVGGYYLESKNWKGALSRFDSALVLDPENPDVYWGLAEAQRHLGDYAGAKANYSKVIEYDPDSKHSKDAKKLLKDPEFANAKSVAASAPATQRQ